MLQMLWNMGGELMRGPAGLHMMPGGMTNDFAPPTTAEAPCANGECSSCRWWQPPGVDEPGHCEAPAWVEQQGQDTAFKCWPAFLT